MDAPTPIWSWPHAILGVIIASISAVFGYLLKRKQLPSQIHKTDAEAAFKQAQTDDLQLRTNMSANEMIREMTRYLIEVERRSAHKDEQIRLLEAQISEFKARKVLERTNQG